MKSFFNRKPKQTMMKSFLEMDYQSILSMNPRQSEQIFSEMQFQVIEAQQELSYLRGE